MSEKCNVVQYISQNCKLPDHSILQVHFKVNENTNINNDEFNHNNEDPQGVNIYRKKRCYC